MNIEHKIEDFKLKLSNLFLDMLGENEHFDEINFNEDSFNWGYLFELLYPSFEDLSFEKDFNHKVNLVESISTKNNDETSFNLGFFYEDGHPFLIALFKSPDDEYNLVKVEIKKINGKENVFFSVVDKD